MSDHVQVLLYTSYLHIIGGIETFIINFLDLMGEKYDIGIYCPKLPQEMVTRISLRARLFTKRKPISCDTLIMVRMMDEKPQNVLYDKSIRMCHACKANPGWHIIQDCDNIIHVSEASRSSFQSDGDVIMNPVIYKPKKALILVSATRVPALDKGPNAERMLRLAEKLNNNNIPFLWFNFSDAPLQGAPKGFINVGTFQDIQPYIAKADYLVQLSDAEGFGYSVAEALVNGCAVICTPFSTTKELGVEDGKNGYVIPFSLDFDVTKLLEVPKFKYSYDNSGIKKAWSDILGPRSDRPSDNHIDVQVIVNKYYDIRMKQEFHRGYQFRTDKDRALELIEKGLVKRI